MNRFCRTPYPASSFTMFSMPTGWGYRGGLLPLPIIGGAFNMVRHEPSAAELSSLLLWLAGYQSHPDKPFKKPTVEDCYTFCGPPDGRNRFCTLSLLLFRFIPPPPHLFFTGPGPTTNIGCRYYDSLLPPRIWCLSVQ